MSFVGTRAEKKTSSVSIRALFELRQANDVYNLRGGGGVNFNTEIKFNFRKVDVLNEEKVLMC